MTRTAIWALLFLAGVPDGGSLPARFTCDGKNVSPALIWSGEPEGTQSFALIVEDPDARNFNFNHWLLWDIPASVHSLAEGAKPEGISGTNDFSDRGYGGPCPPAGTHRYVFRLFAVDVASINLKVEYRLRYGRRL